MLKILDDFRNTLSDIMLRSMHNRVALYGYGGYTGRFIKWYAKYYHNIDVEWLISEDMSIGHGYELEIFRPSVFDFGYKDIKNAVIWLCQPLTQFLEQSMQTWGYEKNVTYFDLYGAIYADDICATLPTTDAFHQKKTGLRDIQFIEWLEWKYNCNFLTQVSKENFEFANPHGTRYCCTTQKELFTILDSFHIHPEPTDAVFDFGCGKGGALLCFMDYGFRHVGGVEFEQKLCDVAKDNFAVLDIAGVELISGDARNVTESLDKYNLFYFYAPFDNTILETVINNIVDSYHRNKRKIRIIYFTAMRYDAFEKTEIFRLTNQISIDSWQRIVGFFESRDL